MSDKDKKLHWYLANIDWRVGYKERIVSGVTGRVFSSETQNINRSKLNEVKEVVKNNLFESHGEHITMLEISILSLSYLGLMTEDEFEQ